jgi:2-dehydro-3-deoxyphosphogluconate aldolase/(4S)-4-hydroxy-2-oxoglutarate aldolase
MRYKDKMEKTIDKTIDSILNEGVILCLRLDDGAQLLDACRAAMRGGLRVLEITLTTPGALETISTLADEGEAVVGGGTVLTIEEARAVAAVGGRFALSPAFHPEVMDEAHLHGILAVPGTATPAETLAAHRHGAKLIKVFPAGALGGPAYLRAIRGPLPDTSLIPTSGPTAETAGDYFAAGAVAVGVGGAEFFPPGFTMKGVEETARRVKEAVDKARKRRWTKR